MPYRSKTGEAVAPLPDLSHSLFFPLKPTMTAALRTESGTQLELNSEEVDSVRGPGITMPGRAASNSSGVTFLISHGTSILKDVSPSTLYPVITYLVVDIGAQKNLPSIVEIKLYWT